MLTYGLRNVTLADIINQMHSTISNTRMKSLLMLYPNKVAKSRAIDSPSDVEGHVRCLHGASRVK